MSLASTNFSDLERPTLAKDLAIRFLWKEYRMLRGFWVAVAGLGIMLQVVLLQLIRNSSLAMQLALVAWGAAALYAVGAAVTLFSAESEERTRGFLLNLPVRWLPIFAAKVTLACITAIGLGFTLCLSGYVIGGGVWPSDEGVRISLSVGGIFVLEALAWGLLFSLWLKQPLLAAVLAIGAASFGTQIAIAITPLAQNSFTLKAFHVASLTRLLVLLPVFAIDVLLGHRWFQVGSLSNRWEIGAGEKSTTHVKETRGSKRPSRVQLMTKLLWQSWKESWKTMLAAVPIALFLMASLSIPLVLHSLSSELLLPLITFLFLPALLGALVFRADQRGDNRQFLVAHAARPRYMWLARQVVWGGSLAFLVGFLIAVCWFLISSEVQEMLMQILYRDYSGYLFGGADIFEPTREPWRVAEHLEYLETTTFQGTLVCSLLVFTAYAFGQFCSLMLHREVLAGLLALIFSVVLVAWGSIVWLWQLSPWEFILPVGIGALVATWLRMPNWIVGRNRPQHWVMPGLAIIIPLLWVGINVPSARLAQLENIQVEPAYLHRVQQFEANRAAGTKVAEQYNELCNSSIDIERLINLTKEPYCYFGDHNQRKQIAHLLKPVLVDGAKKLEDNGKLDEALERHLAWLRFQSHYLQGQPIGDVNLFFDKLKLFDSNAGSFNSTEGFIRWATHPEQKSELIHRAIQELLVCPNLVKDPHHSILATRDDVRKVLLGEEPSQLSEKQYLKGTNYLAYLANELPWERQRALKALDLMISSLVSKALAANREQADIAAARRQLIGGYSYNNLPHMPHPAMYGKNWSTYRINTQISRKASTSYLVNYELRESIYRQVFLSYSVLAKAAKRGLIMQQALLAYRLDHQQYPETLHELVPDYLPYLPLDPYSGKPFQYQPQGFELPVVVHYRPKHLIPPQTPLVWCVGASNREPLYDTLSESDSGFKTWASTPDEIIEIIRLQGTENYNWDIRAAALTLPKIESAESSDETLPAKDQPEEEDSDEVEE